ncbi:MAG: type 2 lanthipeptide synthetase LanM, partial [Vicinamibacteria bacterium]|nr:type 2 lanthipeptide synthetase LanM [Vicinamibacteria bacterium]
MSAEDLRQIAWQAATLHERIAQVDDEAVRDGQGIERDAWGELERAFAPHNRAACERRLSWDGISPERFERAFAPPPARFAAPQWTERLREILQDAAERIHIEQAVDEARRAHALAISPFGEILLPATLCAERALQAQIQDIAPDLSGQARLDLASPLLRELAFISETALLEAWREGLKAHPPDPANESAWPGEFTRSMLQSGLAQLFRRLPVLARDTVLLTETWSARTAELLRRLDRDQADLARLFGVTCLGRLERVKAGLSDRHAGGRRVAMLSFASGIEFVYKPRDLALEAGFQGLAQWAGEQGLPMRPLRILARDGYGWSERARNEKLRDENEVRAYYRSAGALQCLGTLLRGRDLHNENIIATREGPALIDAEALLQPADRDELESEEIDGLRTGLISLVQLDANGTPYDIGGLRAAVPRAVLLGRRQWEGVGTIALRPILATRIEPTLENRVMLNGCVAPPERYKDEIVAGFTDTYRLIRERRADLLALSGTLAALQATHTRVLFRPSDQYGTLLTILATPRYQRDGLTRSLAIETLYRVFQHETARPRLWPLVAEERQALEALDVP